MASETRPGASGHTVKIGAVYQENERRFGGPESQRKLKVVSFEAKHAVMQAVDPKKGQRTISRVRLSALGTTATTGFRLAT